MLRQSLSILKQFSSGAKELRLCMTVTFASEWVTKSYTYTLSGFLGTTLHAADSRVEPDQEAAQVLHKKLQGCMQSQPGLEAANASTGPQAKQEGPREEWKRLGGSWRHQGPTLSLSSQKVYGEPLLSHLSQSEIAAPIQECIHMLLRTGMAEEVLKIACKIEKQRFMEKALFSSGGSFGGEAEDLSGSRRVDLAGQHGPSRRGWEKDLTEKLEQFRVLLKKLPPENYNNLRYLVQFLSLLSEQQAVNKMTPSNIAIVLGPNLLWPRAEGEAALFDMASASSVQVVTVIEPLIQYSSSLFPEAVSFEIPDPPEVPDVTLPAPVAQPLFSEKEKLSRAISSSSSCSSYHTALSKTNSTASQDSVGFFLVKSGSVSRSGTTTWASPVPEPAAPAQQNTTSSSSIPSLNPSPVPASSASTACSSTANPSPSQLPRATGSAPNPGQSRSPTQKQCSDQLEPILEAQPESPRAFVKITSPYKPKRSFTPNKATEQVTVQFSKPKAPGPPKLQAPPPPTTAPVAVAAAAAAADTRTQPTPAPRAHAPSVKKPPQKKPGLKAPNCPPPLPPPSQPKQVPSLAQ
ncbi:SH3 domain-binding protein 1-like protein [Lates japonicus]|uniref:SH3 domain-binding protein 1-like protein n=1 Tax=Lates japonicus TaxID=270547 RepID=A0AAD3MP59_LATJO|nr:SH3 domain-binding protein 1-like protein [Lates japonicus]